jgi:hypothetical protein
MKSERTSSDSILFVVAGIASLEVKGIGIKGNSYQRYRYKR